MLAEIDSQSRSNASAIDSAGDPLTGLFAAFGAIGDLHTQLLRLVDVAPSEIKHDLESLAKAMDPDVSGAIGNPVGALAQALTVGLLNQNASTRVDAYATEKCGTPVFGSVTFSAQQIVSPRKEGDTVFVDLTHVYGESICESNPREVTITRGILAGTCGDHIFGFDLKKMKLTTNVVVGKGVIDSSAINGGFLAALTRDDVPQEGLKPAHQDIGLLEVDLTTGKQLWSLTPNLPPGGPDSLRADMVKDLRVVGVSAHGSVAVDSGVFYVCGRRVPHGAQVYDTTGKVAWSADHIYAMTEDLANGGDGNDRDDCDENVPYVDRIFDPDTGRVIIQGGSYLEYSNTRCSPWIRGRKQVYSNDPPDSFVNVTTGATVPTPDGFFEGVLREGGLVKMKELGELALYSAAGAPKWKLPASVTSKHQIVQGLLVVTDGTGANLVIDGATGKEVRRITELPTALFDDGKWQSEEAPDGGMAFHPADSLWECPSATVLKG